MATLELVETTIPSSTKKEVTETQTLSAGSMVKMEIGENELDAAVPAGKEWDVVANVRIIERTI